MTLGPLRTRRTARAARESTQCAASAPRREVAAGPCWRRLSRLAEAHASEDTPLQAPICYAAVESPYRPCYDNRLIGIFLWTEVLIIVIV